MSSAAHSRAGGFTLVELVVVMAIFGIVAAIAAPSFRDFAIRRNISAQIADFSGALRVARSEALKRGRDVSLCPTNDPLAAKPGCAKSSQNWETGYLVFVGSAAKNDHYLRIRQPSASKVQIRSNGTGAIRFRGNGVLVDGGSRVFTFQPDLDRSDRSFASLTRRMCLSSTGVLSPC